MGLRIFVLFLASTLIGVGVLGSLAEAQTSRRGELPRIPRKLKIVNGAPVAPGAEEQFGLDQALDIFNSSTDTSLYDPITISHLKQMRDEAAPIIHPDDHDVEQTRRVAEKALAIQSGRTFSNLINDSELRSTYRSFMRSVKEIQDTFRFSVQEGAEGVTVSREDKGRKLVELSLEMSAKQGFDPQIRFGENLRFRYDYLEKQPMLEYGFRF